MRVEWALLANAAEGPPNGLIYILGAGLDTFWRPQLPAQFAGAVVIRIAINRSEANRPHAVEIQCNDEDGTPILPQPIVLQLGNVQAPPDLPVGWDISANLVAVLNGMALPRAGLYSFEILLDGQHAKSLPFRVVLGLPPGTIQVPDAGPAQPGGA